jgi:hypothetical protein
MARPPKPWYWKLRDAWYVTVDGRRVRLAAGKAAKKEAVDVFHELMAFRAACPPLGSPRPTVAPVLDAYLVQARKVLAKRTYEDQLSVLQRFAEAIGYYEVAQCRPYHLTSWLEEAGRFKSDWTRLRVVSTVKDPGKNKLSNWGFDRRPVPLFSSHAGYHSH